MAELKNRLNEASTLTTKFRIDLLQVQKNLVTDLNMVKNSLAHTVKMTTERGSVTINNEGLC